MPLHMPRSKPDAACDLAAVALIAAAVMIAIRTTSGLQWPYDPDHFRDIAFAQTALDGHPFSDAYFRGEWIWYNPLMPWLIALGSAISHTAPTLFSVAAGPFFNLLGPIAFYALGVRLAGRPAALAALALSLFFVCQVDCWTCATYSPWLFASTFTQGLFYAAVIGLAAAADRQTTQSGVVAGLLMGVTFLSHTAPAVILVAMSLGVLKRRTLVAAGVTAAIVASPFLFVIAGRYHLHIVNTAPLAWHYCGLTWKALPRTLAANWYWFAAAAILCGCGLGPCSSGWPRPRRSCSTTWASRRSCRHFISGST
jgi:hypothetical protein